MYIKNIVFILLILIGNCVASDSYKGQNQATQVELDEFDDEFNEDEEVEQSSDPLKQYNIVMTNFNDKFYLNVLDPVAKGYQGIIPKPVRSGISNMFYNILFPVRFINNVLQGKFKNAVDEIAVFSVNSTIGFAGFFTIAQDNFALKTHNEDFGQTLGYWGVGSGYHIVLPFLGPSNIRDICGLYIDSYPDVITYNEETNCNITSNSEQTIGLLAFKTINDTSLKPDRYKDLTKDAVELYPYLKNIYEQHRKNLIDE